jgi:TolA-binding protein
MYMATISKKQLVLFVGAAMAAMATGAFAQSSAPPADRVLYDRGIQSIERGDYAGARLTLNALVNTYATSDYQAKAKLAIAVSWLRQGGERALAQAEAEYKDFILFYPNMKEAADQQVGEPLRKIRDQKAAKPRYLLAVQTSRATDSRPVDLRSCICTCHCPRSFSSGNSAAGTR